MDKANIRSKKRNLSKRKHETSQVLVKYLLSTCSVVVGKPLTFAACHGQFISVSRNVSIAVYNFAGKVVECRPIKSLFN